MDGVAQAAQSRKERANSAWSGFRMAMMLVVESGAGRASSGAARPKPATTRLPRAILTNPPRDVVNAMHAAYNPFPRHLLEIHGPSYPPPRPAGPRRNH